MQITSSHVLICTAVTSFASGDTVTFGAEVHAEVARLNRLSLISRLLLSSLDLITRLVKVLSCVVCRAKRRAIKVVEHQIHVLCLLVLQIVTNLYVPMHLYFDMCISLPGQSSRLRKATLVHKLLIARCLLLLASRSVPYDSLHLSWAWVAPAHVLTIVIASLVVATSASEVMIAWRVSSSLLLHLLVHFVCIQVFKEITFLTLVIRNIECITRHVVLLLAIEVFNHGQGIVIWTLLHGCRIRHLSPTKATLMLYLLLLLAWWVLRWRLDNTICVCLHNLLAAPRLTGHRLVITLPWAIDIVNAAGWGLIRVTLYFCWRSHSILLLTSGKHVSWVVKIVRCES